MPAQNETDERLIQQSGEGDREAFSALMQRHQAAVLRLCRALARSPEAAEDVFQETFLAAFRHASGFRTDSSVRTWLFTIARNKAARHYRLKVGEPANPASLESLGLEAGWGIEENPLAQLEAAELRGALKDALDQLPEEDRTVLVLRDLEGLSGKEAADVLGVEIPALKSRLHRARLKLMGALRREYHHGT